MTNDQMQKYIDDEREKLIFWWNNLTRFEETCFKNQYDKRKKELEMMEEFVKN